MCSKVYTSQVIFSQNLFNLSAETQQWSSYIHLILHLVHSDSEL